MHHLTTRALLLLLLAVPLFIAATFVRPLLALAIGYVLLMVGAMVLDAFRAPRAAAIEVERRNDSKLSLGADNPIFLHVRARLPRTLPVVARDEPPDEYDVSQRLLEGEVRPGQTLSLRYTVTPHARGDYAFGNATLRWPGPLGLIVRQHTFALAAPVKVYPNLLEVRKYDLLARTGRLQELGLRRARVFGRGTEFERLREYTPDDEFRQISWKATARRGKPIAIEYQTERSQTVIALLDAGRLMRAPIGPLAKLDYAINTTLLLGYVAGLRGDYVGNLVFADEVMSYLPPKSGRAQFHRLLEVLYNIHSQPTVPDYRRAIAYLKVRRPKRALVVLFTDLASGSDLSELVSAMASLRPRHLPMVVTMNDPGVLALAQQDATSSAAVYERAIAEQLLDERRLVLDQLEQRGILTIDVPASKLTTAVINRYLVLKARGLL
ncbi:MAG: DUF58 domain-containing protein [Ardenticatenales bacterium]|nr:DUF58 domain-containing protein [Ardenticatenales bacterium]